nr:sodium:proton exchanger [Neisseria meningitidis]
MFGNHGLCGLLEEGAHEKSPKCLGGNLGDFGEFCKGLLLFDVAFAVVVLSLLIRGMTIPVMARLLKVAMPNKPEPKDTHDIWLAKKEIVRMSAFKVVAESEAEGHHPDTVEPISDSFGARCFALIRNGIRIEMQSDTVLQAGIWRGTSCPTARSI